MTTDRVSARQIAAFIKERPELFDGVTVSADTVKRFLDPDPESGKVADVRVVALELYLKSEAAAKSVPARRNRPSSLFPVVQDFFNMRPEKASQYRDGVTGLYTFYAYSEKGRDRVCRGAIEFSVDPVGQFTVKEIQKSVPPGGDTAYNEVFTGYFLFRETSLIAILRDDQYKHPKFYILSIEPYTSDAGKHMVMYGSLLKIGADRCVFSGNTYMIRKDTAFDECTMLDRPDVPPTIIQFLDSC
jgi:hypothetical protein